MPRKRKNPVSLSEDDRATLEGLIAGGHAPARQLTHARILLEGRRGRSMLPTKLWPDTKIADALEISRSTVARVRERFVAGGTGGGAGPSQAARLPNRKKLDGEQEAHLIALACSEPPKGKKRWSVRLLAERFVGVGVRRGAHLPRVGPAHYEKSAIKPWLKRAVVHPAKARCLLRLAHGGRP